MHALSLIVLLQGLKDYNKEAVYVVYFIYFTADTHIFIAGSEDPSKLNSDIHYLWAQNHTLKEQLNQAARGIDTNMYLSPQLMTV